VTFLEIAQRVATRAPTSGARATFATVVNAQGVPGKIVQAVQAAWTDVQTRRADWLWMQASFQGSILAGPQDITANDLDIPRFGRWLVERRPGSWSSFAILPAGETSWRRLRFLPWPEFSACFRDADVVSGLPYWISLTPARGLALHPTPDAAMQIKGRYVRSIQTLAVDDDEPEMPADYHDLLVSMGLVNMATHDESFPQRSLWQLEADQRYGALVRDQTPDMIAAEALA
jgi:hypothetical protein